MIFASSLLSYTPGTSEPMDVSNLPGALQDAWHVMAHLTAPPIATTAKKTNKSSSNPTNDVFDPLIPAPVVLLNDFIVSAKQGDDKVLLGRGKLGDMAHVTALSTCLKRAATCAADLQTRRTQSDGPALLRAMTTAKEEAVVAVVGDDSASYHNVWLTLLEERLRQVREYHARHSTPLSTTTTLATTTSIMTDGSTTATSLPTLGLKRKRMKLGNVAADGYDLSSTLLQTLQPLVEEEGYFTTEEVMGKYLDFRLVFQSHVVPLTKTVFSTNQPSNNSSSSSKTTATAAPTFTLSDFVTLLLHPGLSDGISEEWKLKERKKYAKFLTALLDYVQSFLQRTSPLLNVTQQILQPALQDFTTTWRETGGHLPGWQAKPTERLWVDIENNWMEPEVTPTTTVGDKDTTSTTDTPTTVLTVGLDLSPFDSAEALAKVVDGDALKMELARLGLKCGGTVADRAKRLFMTKNTPLDQLPAKLFAKGFKRNHNDITNIENETTTTTTSVVNTTVALPPLERRVDLARLEVMVTALLDQLRPTLEATLRRLQRQQAQTLKEREQEMFEELHGAPLKPRDENDKSGNKKDKDDEDDEDDEEDAPIYNPKGVPLGWDGKPIPYWLYKLHGLNHFYECEICGNESYRGRMNFEKHFTEAKHSYGMKCLGIPNTKHFHGVTKIDDAQQLWKTLSEELNVGQFDATREEEYEDSHGNVLSRNDYEDLARQGLL